MGHSLAHEMIQMVTKTKVFSYMKAEGTHEDYPIQTHMCSECCAVFGIDREGLMRYTHLVTQHPEILAASIMTL